MPDPKPPTPEQVDEYNDLVAAAQAASMGDDAAFDAANKKLKDFMRTSGIANEVPLDYDDTAPDPDEGKP